MTYPLKALILLDKECDRERIDEALQMANHELRSYSIYPEGVVSLKCDVVERDFSQMPWNNYSANSGGRVHHGADITTLIKETNAVWENHGPSYDTAVYIFARKNWEAKKYAGWNLGVYNNLGLQVMKEQKTAKWNKNLLLHEVMHVFDDLYRHDQGKNLDKIIGFDYDQDPRYGVHRVDEDGNYIYEFSELFGKIQPFVMANIVYRRWSYRDRFKDRMRMDLENLFGLHKKEHKIRV